MNSDLCTTPLMESLPTKAKTHSPVTASKANTDMCLVYSYQRKTPTPGSGFLCGAVCVSASRLCRLA
jgi:hypothetical protein